MTGHYITPFESVLKKEVKKILSVQKREIPEIAQKILWIDLTQGEKISEKWKKSQYLFNTKYFDAVCALVPDPPDESLNWAFIYQILCYLVFFQKKKKIAFYYLIIPSEDSSQHANRQKQIFAFIKHALETSLHISGIYRFKAFFFDNLPGNMESTFYKNIALDTLDQVKKKLNKESSTFLSEQYPLIHGDFRRAFGESLRQTAIGFSSSLPATAAVSTRQNFTAIFGDLKERRIETLIEALRISNNQIFSSHQPLFIAPDTPLANIYEELDSFHLFLPNCFSHPLDPDFIPELPPPSQELPESLFCSVQCGSDNGMPSAQEGSLLHGIMEIFEAIGPQIGQLSSNLNRRSNRQHITRVNRGQLKLQLRQEFGELLQMITALVDNEHRLLSNDNDLLFRDPDIFRNAYINFQNFFLNGFLFPITLSAWTTRKFIFFIPMWCPAPFFKRTGIFPIICDLMIQVLRLLNLYRYIHFSLANYREEFESIGIKITEIQKRSQGIDQQLSNIEEELNLNPHYQERIRNDSALDDLFFIETPLPEKATLIEENLRRAETLTAIKKWTSNVLVLVKASFKDSKPFEDESYGKYWVPGYYNFHEAWKISEQMIEVLKKSRLFRFDKVVSSLPQGMCVYKYCDYINDLNSENEWFQWKKHALQNCDVPFAHDVIHPPAIFSKFKDISIDQFIEWGVKHKILIQDTQGRLSLCNEAYSFLHPEERPFFFQRNKPLSQRIFYERLHNHAYHKIIGCLKWIMDRDYFQKTRFQHLRGNVDRLIVLKPTSDESRGVLFDILDQISDNEQTLIHPYFGKFINTPSLFFIENTLDPILMDFLKPESKQHCKPRFFSIHYLKASLENEEGVLHAITRVFDSISILNYNFSYLNN